MADHGFAFREIKNRLVLRTEEGLEEETRLRTRNIRQLFITENYENIKISRTPFYESRLSNVMTFMSTSVEC